MTRLFIAEKPDMGRKIAEALNGPKKTGKGYIETGEGIVTWCVGHILKSWDPEDYDKEYNTNWKEWNLATLPIIPPEWRMKVESSKKEQFQIIKTLLAKSTEVVNAGDPGREGQLIVDEVLVYLKYKKPTYRILLDALDKKSVRDALNNLRDNKEQYNLYLAAVSRSYADYVVGINGTRAYTLAGQKQGYRSVLSVGRVQSPTLAIVVRRDEEIEKFIPHAFYTINATFNFNNKSFVTTWKPNSKTPATSLDESKRLIDANLAQAILAKTKDKNGKVIDYTEGKGKSSQPLAFNLSKLQIYASAKWGMSAEEVLNTCQSLYQNHELQSYPRTDCQYFKEEHHADAPIITVNIAKAFPHLANAVNGANLSIKSQVWNTKKISDHYGLMPTQKEADMSKLNSSERKIYQAVCERYLAQFYPEHEYNTTNILINCEDEHFKVSGRVVTVAGWKSIFEDEAVDDTKDKDGEDDESQTLPAMKNGDTVNFVSNKKSDKMTKPPARFTEGTLIHAMTNVDTLVSDPAHKAKLKDKKGIGQESTRVQILKNLFDKNFIVKDGKKLISTPAARALIHNLPKQIIDPAWTAIWEDILDKIADGTVSVDAFKKRQHLWVEEIIEESKKAKFSDLSSFNKEPQGKGKAAYKTTPKPAAKPTGKKCPTCSTGELVERVSGKGTPFLACNAYPKCKHIESIKK